MKKDGADEDKKQTRAMKKKKKKMATLKERRKERREMKWCLPKQGEGEENIFGEKKRK